MGLVSAAVGRDAVAEETGALTRQQGCLTAGFK